MFTIEGTLAGKDAARFVRSTRCSAGNCVEVLLSAHDAKIRDSKQAGLGASQPILVATPSEFADLQTALVKPRSDTQRVGSIVIEASGDAQTVFRSLTTGVELRFDQDEIDAFVAGIKAGEFTPEALMQPVG